MLKLKFILIFNIVLIASLSYSKDAFYKGRARGWHWYETKPKEEEKENIENEKIDKNPEDTSKLSPTEIINNIKKDTEAKLHKAIITPTEENIIAYIKAQEKIGDSSEKFAKVWQKVIYKNPILDRTLKYPISNNALHLARKDDLELKREKIRELSKEYGLMFFFRGDCKYCQGFATIVQNFSKLYNWDLMPIQIGTVTLPEFKNATHDNGVSEKLGITTVPALIAVHPKTGNMIPLAFGYVSEDEIEDRIDNLVVRAEVRQKNESKQ